MWSALQNLLDPAVLFFFLGCTIALLRSNLEIPPALTSFFSLYLLLSLGFKGGVSLAENPIELQMIITIVAGMLLAITIPALAFLYLKRRFSYFDAAAIAAAYGSVSAVTFITATQFLERNTIAFSGYMTVVMVLMETPAILMAIALAHYARKKSNPDQSPTSWSVVLREAITDGPHLLLIGSLVIGLLVNTDGQAVMQPFTGELFKGFLAFFLLEMGMSVVRKGRELTAQLKSLFVFGIGMPIIAALIACVVVIVTGINIGNGVLLMTLAASASYIVVPAIARHSIPEANPSLYFGSALIITFPFNIIIGIPLYHTILTALQ
ncbi:MAG: sodium-dependent bicarbonate transport family permease [Roseiflexaceae bacterium]